MRTRETEKEREREKREEENGRNTLFGWLQRSEQTSQHTTLWRNVNFGRDLVQHRTNALSFEEEHLLGDGECRKAHRHDELLPQLVTG
jgi:hypothetical protein